MSVSYYGDSPRDDTTFVQNCQSAPFFVQLYVFVFRTIFFNKKDELNKTIYQLPHHKKIWHIIIMRNFFSVFKSQTFNH